MRTTVSYLGPAGTFTEAAVCGFARRGIFGEPPAGQADEAGERGAGDAASDAGGIQPLPLDSVDAVLDAVRDGRARAGVMAIENSIDGPVTAAFDALVHGGVQIYAELDLPIEFTVMAGAGLGGEGLADMRTIACHPVGHQQITGWLSRNAPQARFVPAPSNAAAARMASAGEVDAAAAPDRAAELFGLGRLARGVIDAPDARTRFVAVRGNGRPPRRTGQDRTCVAFRLPNTPGSLYAALGEFAHRGVDLSRIASRPARESFGTYTFYADIVGHVEDAPVAEALRALWLTAEWIEFLGSWPNTTDPEGRRVAGPELHRIAQATAWVRGVQEGSAQGNSVQQEGEAGWRDE